MTIEINEDSTITKSTIKEKIFCVVVHGAPFSSQGAMTALQFCQSLLNDGHKLHRVFFYGDGVQNANQLITPPEDEINIPSAWTELQKEHELDLVVCVAAALRRGVINETEAKRWHAHKTSQHHNLADGFELSGLGQLMDALANADRTLHFGL